MAELDMLAPNYRRAQDRWRDAPTLATCYEALNACFSGTGHGMVEHVKAFVESVCVTIILEFDEEPPGPRPTRPATRCASTDVVPAISAR